MDKDHRPSQPKEFSGSVNTSYMQQQQQPYKTDKEWTYYRITYRGVVALVSDPTQALTFEDQDSGSTASSQLNLNKTGAYLSYGEIIATYDDMLEIDVPLSQSPAALQNSNKNKSPSSFIRYRFIRVDDVLTGGYAVDAISEKSGNAFTNEAGTLSEYDSQPLANSQQDSEDGLSSSFSQTYPLSTRPHLGSVDTHVQSPSSPIHPLPFGYLLISSSTTLYTDLDDPCIASIKITTCPHPSHSTQNPEAASIVQRIPHPPLLCQVGTFFYKVTSPTPLPILVGPCDDAPTLTHAKLLPDTVQEVSLRIGSVFSYGDNDNIPSKKSSSPLHVDLASLSNPKSLEDGIVYLRLSHKKGWIADRRRIYSPMIGGRGDDRKSIDSSTSTSPQLQYQMLVKDITHLIESIGGGGEGHANLESLFHSATLNDLTFTKGQNHHSMETSRNHFWEQQQDKQVGSSSSSSVMSSLSSISSSAMSTLSISTPLNVLRMRQRKKIGAKQKGNASESIQSASSMPIMKIDGVQTSKENMQSPSRNMSMKISKPFVLEPLPDTKEDLRKPHDKDNIQSSKRTTLAPETEDSNSRSRPNLYLMRVHAPTGLKILDASHFQVNHLIRRPSTSTASVHSGSSTSGVSSHLATNSSEDNPSHSTKKNLQPSSIFHTMNGGLISPKSTPTVAWEMDSSTGKRYLPRGLVFEASKRMEKASNFVEAMGLIKLADNTGWAIVPTREDLLSQYSSTSADNCEKNVSSVDAFEEIGNAFLRTSRENETSTSSTRVSGCWLRIIHRDGVTVFCSPLHSKQHGVMNDDTNMTNVSDSSLLKGRDTDSVSSTGSMSDALKSSAHSKKYDGRKKSSGDKRSMSKEQAIESDRSTLTAAFRNSAQHHIQRNFMSFRISCGLCVEVEQSQDSNSYKSQKFVRLCGGMGWIPQVLNGVVCSVEITKPTIRYGSFWFRVVTKDGVTVRTCPYQQANVIKSDDDICFRFECGEFLRASEVFTADIVDDYHQDMGSKFLNSRKTVARKSESFAKLYRRGEDNTPSIASSAKSESNRFLANLVTRGEWVQILYGDSIYMEECENAPVIQRRRDGWNYKVVHEAGEDVRYGPSFMAEATGSRIKEGDVCVVNEIVTARDDKVTWLRLKNGKGWINTHTPNDEPVAVAIISSLDLEDSSVMGAKSDEPSYGKIFGRLF